MVSDNGVGAFEQYGAACAFGGLARGVDLGIGGAFGGGGVKFGGDVGEETFEFACVRGEDALVVKEGEELVGVAFKSGEGIRIQHRRPGFHPGKRDGDQCFGAVDAETGANAKSVQTLVFEGVLQGLRAGQRGTHNSSVLGGDFGKSVFWAGDGDKPCADAKGATGG